MPAARTKDERIVLHRKIRRLAASGLHRAEVARRCGVSHTAVRWVLTHPPPDREARGARWLAMVRAGTSPMDVARSEGVSRATVYRGLDAAREAEAAGVRASLGLDAG